MSPRPGAITPKRGCRHRKSAAAASTIRSRSPVPTAGPSRLIPRTPAASRSEEHAMSDAKLAPNLPDWMVEHANRYLASGGADGHLYEISQPGRPKLTVPSLL